MRVVPQILLKEGDLVESPNGNSIWCVVGSIEWNPILSDGANVFCPRWGFYFREYDEVFTPIVDNSSTMKRYASYFHFDNETTYDFAS